MLASVEGAIKTLLEKGDHVLMKDGKEIFRGTKKNVEAFSEILKKLSTKESDNLIERIVKRRNSKLSFSNKATKTLDEFVNNALIKWKNVEERAGATATLEGTLEGKIIQITNYSSKGLIKAQIRAKRHKLVDDWLENIASQKIKNRRNHGRCAEPINISEWLFKAEKDLGMQKNSMKIEQARALFSDVISKAKSIHNTERNKIAHGLNKSACDSCNPLLEYFNH